MRNALVRLIAWHLESRYLDPRSTTVIACDRYDVISGHRDAMSSTSCPGRYVYEWLPTLRKRVADRMGNWRSAIHHKWQSLGGESGWVGSPFVGERVAGDGRYTVFNGADIYWHPRTGAHEVHGRILGKYRRLGGASSTLGYPRTDERATDGSRGRVTKFQRGDIYHSPATGPHEVHGLIRHKYVRLGGPKSKLGLPTSDERDTDVGGGKVGYFQNGRIYHHRSTGPSEVHGGILRRYVRMGGAESRLGPPTSDEYAVAGGRRSDFRNGHIFWSFSARRAIVRTD